MTSRSATWRGSTGKWTGGQGAGRLIGVTVFDPMRYFVRVDRTSHDEEAVVRSVAFAVVVENIVTGLFCQKYHGNRSRCGDKGFLYKLSRTIFGRRGGKGRRCPSPFPAG